MTRTAMATTAILLLVVAASDAADKAAKAAAKCAAGKQKAAVKKIGSELACHQKAARTGAAVDPTCLAKAETTFRKAVARIEAKGGCIVTGDQVAIEQAADACADDLRTLTPSAPPTCGESVFPQCGGSCLPGLVCQAFLRTSTTCNPGQGGGPQTQCSSFCECVPPTAACDGQPCGGRVCRRTIQSSSCGGPGSDASTCCGGFGDRCGAGNPACCCANSCFAPPIGGNASCITSLSCNVSGTGTVCQ